MTLLRNHDFILPDNQNDLVKADSQLRRETIITINLSLFRNGQECKGGDDKAKNRSPAFSAPLPSTCQSLQQDPLPLRIKRPILSLPVETTALVIIDVQPEYWTDCPIVQKDFPNFPMNLARVIEICRSRGVKIIWIRADYRYSCSPWLVQFRRLRGDDNIKEVPCDLTSSELVWEDFARPINGEIIIPKHSFSSTSNTALLEVLKASHTKTVLTCGLITSVCVHHSSFGIFEAGFRTILVQDACADRGIERHKAAIQLYGGYMYDVVDSMDLESEETGIVPIRPSRIATASMNYPTVSRPAFNADFQVL